jgi:hypothetical protein
VGRTLGARLGDGLVEIADGLVVESVVEAQLVLEPRHLVIITRAAHHSAPWQTVISKT